MMTPQAMRLPALPVGSVFMSSALLVDHDGGAAVGEDGVGRGGVEGEVVDFEGGLAGVAFADGDVLGQVAVVVAHGVQGAVLLAVGVEVAAGGFEVGWRRRWGSGGCGRRDRRRGGSLG